MERIPRAPECALACDGERGVGLLDFGVVDVDALAEISRGQGESDVRTYVFVDKGRIRSFPSCDASTAVTQRHKA